MSSILRSTTTQTAREAGMVSIMVSLILMIVLSLIVLGFAQVARRNQRETLDRQLSTQAFYAAETGVNDVRDYIASLGATAPAKTSCDNSGAYASLPAASLSNANNVAYTCVLVDPTPNLLSFTSVGGTPSGTPSGTGLIVPLDAGSDTIKTLTFQWFNTDATNIHPATGCPASAVKVFSKTSSWTCGYGVLRFDLVPTGGSLNAATLQANAMSSFVVPLNGGPSAAAGFATNGSSDLISTGCNDTSCKLTINAGLGGSQYYLRVTTLYKPVGFQISGTDPAGTAVSFQGAQAVIDATGKAQDVLRRIQVRIPLGGTSNNQVGNYALETTDSICKRFSVMDGYFQSNAAAVVSGMEPSGNPLCQ